MQRDTSHAWLAVVGSEQLYCHEPRHIFAIDAGDGIHDTTTGALYYDADGSGAAAAVQIALLTGAPTLSNADFVVS